MKHLELILLIDDNEADNEFHRVEIELSHLATHVKIIDKSREALAYLTQCLTSAGTLEYPLPDLVFLDINMPAMNGFEMIDKLRLVPDTYGRKQHMKIFMLTGSLNPDDYKRATEEYYDYIEGFRIKPLTDIVFTEIIKRHF